MITLRGLFLNADLLLAFAAELDQLHSVGLARRLWRWEWSRRLAADE